MLTEGLLSGGGVGHKRRLFTLSLLLSTWIPMGSLIALGYSETPGPGLQAATAILVFVNGLHVAATLCLYVDRQFLRLVWADRGRYVYGPAGIILGSGLIFGLATQELQAYWLLTYWAWQAYHYGRQNLGIYALTSLAEGRRVDGAARRALGLATACAVCGTFKVLGLAVAPAFLHSAFDWLHRAGMWAFVIVLGFGVYVFLAKRKDFSPRQAAAFATALLFFAPLFLSSNVTVAFSSYAVAHGIQYMVIVGILASSVARNEGRGGLSGRMMGLIAGVILLGALVYLRDAGWGGAGGPLRTALDFAAGMALGTAAAHFFVDAGAWRLSHPRVRAYMGKRFGFLLGSPELRSAT